MPGKVFLLRARFSEERVMVLDTWRFRHLAIWTSGEFIS